MVLMRKIQFTDITKTYSFLDESGFLVLIKSKTTNYFGLGFIKFPDPFEINQSLHLLHQQLCSDLKKDDTRIEFSFKGITKKTFPTTLKALDLLNEYESWEFHCLYFDTTDSQFIYPKNSSKTWSLYISNIKLIIQRTLWANEETILVSDFLRKPKQSNKKYEYIMLDIPQVYNVLQIISHGVLLVQLADLLLGGFLYHKGGYCDKEGYKKRVSEKVISMKKELGKDRFNVWEKSWDKKNSR